MLYLLTSPSGIILAMKYAGPDVSVRLFLAINIPRSLDEGWLDSSDNKLLRNGFDIRVGFSGVWCKRTSINSFFGFIS